MIGSTRPDGSLSDTIGLAVDTAGNVLVAGCNDEVEVETGLMPSVLKGLVVEDEIVETGVLPSVVGVVVDETVETGLQFFGRAIRPLIKPTNKIVRRPNATQA